MTKTAQGDEGSAVGPAPAEPGPPPQTADAGHWYWSSGPHESLRWLAEDFARNFVLAAAAVVRAEVSLRLAAAGGAARSHFLETLEEPTCSYPLVPSGAATDDDAAIWLEFSPPAAFALIESLLGAREPSAPVPDRPLTATERRVLHRPAELVAASLSGAWPGEAKPHLRAERGQVAAPEAGAAQRVLVATFELTVAGRTGALRLRGPEAALADAAPPAPQRPTASATLALSAAVEGILIDEQELAGLAEGDIIATDTPADGEVILRIGGIPKFAAKLALADGRRALTITRRLDAQADAKADAKAEGSS